MSDIYLCVDLVGQNFESANRNLANGKALLNKYIWLSFYFEIVLEKSVNTTRTKRINLSDGIFETKQRHLSNAIVIQKVITSHNPNGKNENFEALFKMLIEKVTQEKHSLLNNTRKFQPSQKVTHLTYDYLSFKELNKRGYEVDHQIFESSHLYFELEKKNSLSTEKCFYENMEHFKIKVNTLNELKEILPVFYQDMMNLILYNSKLKKDQKNNYKFEEFFLYDNHLLMSKQFERQINEIEIFYPRSFIGNYENLGSFF